MDTGTVIGIDASSTRLAAVVRVPSSMVPGVAIHSRYITKMPLSDHERCATGHRWASELVAKFKPVLVVLEAPFISHAHPTGSVGVIQVNGAILAALSESNVVSVPPSQWKSRVLGQGNASKAMIDTWVLENCPGFHRETHAGLKGICQDLMDAYCLARYAESVYTLRERLRKPAALTPHHI